MTPEEITPLNAVLNAKWDVITYASVQQHRGIGSPHVVELLRLKPSSRQEIEGLPEWLGWAVRVDGRVPTFTLQPDEAEAKSAYLATLKRLAADSFQPRASVAVWDTDTFLRDMLRFRR